MDRYAKIPPASIALKWRNTLTFRSICGGQVHLWVYGVMWEVWQSVSEVVVLGERAQAGRRCLGNWALCPEPDLKLLQCSEMVKFNAWNVCTLVSKQKYLYLFHQNDFLRWLKWLNWLQCQYCLEWSVKRVTFTKTYISRLSSWLDRWFICEKGNIARTSICFIWTSHIYKVRW